MSPKEGIDTAKVRVDADSRDTFLPEGDDSLVDGLFGVESTLKGSLSGLAPLRKLKAEKARRNLRTFIETAWPLVEPVAFVPGWHIDAIAEHLEAITRGDSSPAAGYDSATPYQEHGRECNVAVLGMD